MNEIMNSPYMGAPVTQDFSATVYPVQSQPSVANVDPAVVASAESAKARIQAAYIMALNRPRNEDRARLAILQSCKRFQFAERVEYAKPVGGGKFIQGPTIRFAETAIRLWGNIDCQNEVVYEDDKVRRIRVTVTDLETNSTHSKEISVSKRVERSSDKGREVVGKRINSYGNTVYIVVATDEEMQQKVDSAVSKALRNEGLRLIPSDIIDEAIATARWTLSQRDNQDPERARRNLIDAFYALGVMPEDIAKIIGHDIKVITDNDTQQLRSIYASLKSGEAKISDFLPSDNPELDPATEKAKAKLAELASKKNAEKKKKTEEKKPEPVEVKKQPESLVSMFEEMKGAKE